MGSRNPFGALVRAARERAGLSCADVAARVVQPFPERGDAGNERARERYAAWLEGIEANGRGGLIEHIDVEMVAVALGLPVVPDAWWAALAMVPADIDRVLRARSEVWDAVRELALPHSACVVIRRNGRFAAIRSRKRGGSVELPGGKGEPGESPQDIARREVREEVGLEVSLLVPLHRGSDGGGYLAHVFAAPWVEGELRSSDEGEAFWATADELLGGTYGALYRQWPAVMHALGGGRA